MAIGMKIEDFSLDPDKTRQIIEMPVGATPLSLKVVGKKLVIFAFVPTGKVEKREREVQIFNKGQDITKSGVYIDTILMDPSSTLTARHVFINP